MTEPNLKLDIKDFYLSGKSEIEIDIDSESGLKGNLNLIKSDDELILIADLVTETEETCDRCLEKANIRRNVHFERVYTKKKDKISDEVKLLPQDFQIDLSEPLQEEIILSKPFKNLCKDDCRGLCQKCGANLNQESKHKCS